MAKIRPINRTDIKNFTSIIDRPLEGRDTRLSGTVESAEIFGDVERSKEKKEEPKKEFKDISYYNKRGHIELALPVLNFFTAGSKLEILKTILCEPNIERIAAGQVMFDTVANKCIETDSKERRAYSPTILIGGQYIQKLIDDLDVEEELLKCATKIVYKALKASVDFGGEYKDFPIEKCGTFSYDSGAVNVFEDIYYTPSVNIDLETFKLEVKKGVVEALDNYHSRITLLLSIRHDKSALRDQVMEIMVVLPIGYRPRFQSKKHKLTSAYDRVVRLNEDLRNIIKLANPDLASVRTHYTELVMEVKNVMVKRRDEWDKQYKTIMEMLKGKKGIIRDKMQGSRIDYSARSVIIVDPAMSVDTIGIPIGIAERLAELEIVERYGNTSGNQKNKADILNAKYRFKRQELAKEILDGSYGVTGRQPTLYQLGLQGFKLKIVDGNAIKLSPLVCPAFNADFDGDQMHFEIPIGEKAKEEVRKLMASTQNIFLPRSGDCHIAPRQEIIHGLWVAHTVKEGHNESPKRVSVGDKEQFFEDVCNQVINVYDTTTYKGKDMTAGKAALLICLTSRWDNVVLGVMPITRDSSKKEKPVSEKFFKELLKRVGMEDKEHFVPIVNNLVKLGFAITNIFPPSIPVVGSPDVTYIIDEFDKTVSEREELYDLGFETEAAYTSFFSKAYDTMVAKMDKVLLDGFTDKNGYVQMKESGARGNMSNIRQTFGMKGRVMKNSLESFNAILKHSLVQQLTGLEHFITAYGARQGLIDKSIETYGPGYLSRQMSHTASGTYIRSEDCGTKNGMLLTFDFLKQFVGQGVAVTDEVALSGNVRKLISQVLKGRFVQEYDKLIETDQEVDDLYNKFIATHRGKEFSKLGGLHLRSPITCEDPCCVKCYGINLLTNRLVRVGTPVGFIASQAIGEPGTQLTMKNFQSGGVAGVKNLTSSFQTVQTYLRMEDLANKSKGMVPINYDYISPYDGEIQTIMMGNGIKKLRIMHENTKGEMVNQLSKAIYLVDTVKLKKHVKRGDSIQLIQGDLNVKEVIEHRSAEEGERYLTMFLFNIFQKEVFVSLKHFEMVVSNMVFKLCLKGNGYFKTGLYYMNTEYYHHDRTGCEFVDAVIGVNDVPSHRNDLLGGIMYADIQKCIERNIVTSGRDEMKQPITRYAFGLNIGVGSDVPGYLENA